MFQLRQVHCNILDLIAKLVDLAIINNSVVGKEENGLDLLKPIKDRTYPLVLFLRSKRSSGKATKESEWTCSPWSGDTAENKAPTARAESDATSAFEWFATYPATRSPG